MFDNASNKSDEEQPSESTNLIEQSDGSPSSEQSTQVLLEEMENPWPSTFERSISLLASPVMTPKRVDLVTKSPKPGNTPIFGGGVRGSVRGMRRGFDTPEQPKDRRLLRPLKSFDTGDIPSSMQTDKKGSLSSQFKQGMQKTMDTQQKASEARQKVLAAQMKNQPTKPKGAADKATFAQCVFNMSNILMGVGLLGLPFVLSSAGWIGGLCVMTSFCLITWRTAKLIGRQLNGDPRSTAFFEDSPYKSPIVPGSGPGARVRAPMTSFPQIAREAFGDKGNLMLSSVLYFELFSCLCIFLVSIGDHLYTLYPNIPKSVHMVIMAGVLTIPTAVLRTPRLLSYLSMVGTLATVTVVLTVFVSALFEGDISDAVLAKKGLDNTDDEPTHILWRTSGLPIALGLIAYTFSGHAIVPSVYSSMDRPQDFEKMIDVTFAVVLGACLVVAASGYYMFGSAVDDQVTISLEENSSAVYAMKCLAWLMILTAFSKFALTMFPLALGIEEIVAPYVCNDAIMSATDSIIKMSLIILSLLVALFVPSFSYICALVGLICTMAVSVIFPAAAHLSLFGRHLSVMEKTLNWLFVVFGCIVAVVGTIATV